MKKAAYNPIEMLLIILSIVVLLSFKNNIGRYFNIDPVGYNIETMNKIAIIDIDNTLWQFCDVFFQELRKINRDFPTVEQWTHWDVWEGYCSKQEFYGAVNAIHLKQDNDEFRPYPESRGFLQALKNNGYHITIASHRSPEFFDQTKRWLLKHGLAYDDIHLSYHKTDLINANTDVVVDDAPQVLEKAVEQGALATGLLFPWNREYQHNGFRLYGNLNDILKGILRQ